MEEEKPAPSQAAMAAAFAARSLLVQLLAIGVALGSAILLGGGTWAVSQIVWVVAVFSVASSVLQTVLVTRPVQVTISQQEALVAAREADLLGQARRQKLDSRLSRALEMADVEEDALDVVTRAMQSVTDAPAELLLADSSKAHLVRAAQSGPDGIGPGCGVASPSNCAAVRRGQTMSFASSDDLDACPHLRARPTGACSAACVPVTILGQAVGVLHTTAADHAPPDQRTVGDLETVATQLSARVGMIRALARSEVQASTDPLTGLLNRRSLDDQIGRIAGGDRAYAVVMVDLDHFKGLNDAHGHDTGDRSLRIFAATLRNAVRPGDLVSRHGGEEFLVVFPDTDADAAAAVAERVREALALALTDGAHPTFTASFGVADHRVGRTFADVVAAADAALLTAKRDGRNRVVLAPHLAAVDHQVGPLQRAW